MSGISDINNREKYVSFETNDNKLWRHTIGRISCLARIPIYGTALLFQGVETGLKAIVSPLPSLIGYLGNTDALQRWSFSGVAKDGLMALKLLDKIGSSVLGVFCAPPKEYFSFSESIKSSIDVIGGVYHLQRNDEVSKIKDVANMVFTTRPHYSKIIFAKEFICSEQANISAWRNRIKAG